MQVFAELMWSTSSATLLFFYSFIFSFFFFIYKISHNEIRMTRRGAMECECYDDATAYLFSAHWTVDEVELHAPFSHKGEGSSSSELVISAKLSAKMREFHQRSSGQQWRHKQQKRNRQQVQRGMGAGVAGSPIMQPSCSWALHPQAYWAWIQRYTSKFRKDEIEHRVRLPGTVIDDALLEERSGNYPLCANIVSGRAGIAFVDVSTGAQSSAMRWLSTFNTAKRDRTIEACGSCLGLSVQLMHKQLIRWNQQSQFTLSVFML